MSYWDWLDELLRHRDGRATGGELCVRCGKPIQPNAYWKYRDRHVCSARCNKSVRDRLRRALARGETPAAPRPEPMANPRSVPCPWTFRTLAESDQVHGIPYDFDGFGPLPGDVVERDGSIVSYGNASEVPGLVPQAEWLPSTLILAVHSSDHALVYGANDTESRPSVTMSPLCPIAESPAEA